MKYFRTCPYCHANLDPGERCDCREQQEVNAAGAAYQNERKSALPVTERRVTVTVEAGCPAWKVL